MRFLENRVVLPTSIPGELKLPAKSALMAHMDRKVESCEKIDDRITFRGKMYGAGRNPWANCDGEITLSTPGKFILITASISHLRAAFWQLLFYPALGSLTLTLILRYFFGRPSWMVPAIIAALFCIGGIRAIRRAPGRFREAMIDSLRSLPRDSSSWNDELAGI